MVESKSINLNQTLKYENQQKKTMKEELKTIEKIFFLYMLVKQESYICKVGL